MHSRTTVTMDHYKFELDDITDIKLIDIDCSRCRAKPVPVTSLVFHGYMETSQADRKDVCAIFCQGYGDCNGKSWAFPVSPDNSLVQLHEALPELQTNN